MVTGAAFTLVVKHGWGLGPFRMARKSRGALPTPPHTLQWGLPASALWLTLELSGPWSLCRPFMGRPQCHHLQSEAKGIPWPQMLCTLSHIPHWAWAWFPTETIHFNLFPFPASLLRQAIVSWHHLPSNSLPLCLHLRSASREA